MKTLFSNIKRTNAGRKTTLELNMDSFPLEDMRTYMTPKTLSYIYKIRLFHKNMKDDEMKMLCEWCPNLEDVDLRRNRITTLDFIHSLPHLRKLDCDSCGTIIDVGALSLNTSITYIELSYNPIARLPSLINNTTLTKLRLSNCLLTNLEFIRGNRTIDELIVCFNKITSIDALKDNDMLTILSISENPVHDISPLKNNSTIQYLDIHGCRVKDISPLRNNSSIRSLLISYNPIDDMSSIAHSPSINFLMYQHASFSNETKIYFEKLTRCNEDNIPNRYTSYHNLLLKKTIRKR